tara:strand:+ start:7999 stop:9165 length:1167 start_codon:yes stop_codon:yes gene_type:complete
MAYVNLKESGMSAGIAKIVGKLQGKLAANVIAQTTEISDNFRSAGCPTLGKLDRLKNKQQNLNKSLSSINGRLNKFRKLPKALKLPVKALKVIIKVISALPIPLSIPPGFGLPANFPIKFGDLLVKMKEMITQIEVIITGVEAVLETPASQLSAISTVLSRTESAISSCQVSAQIEEDLKNGNLNKDELKDLGLMDDDEITIFSTLGPLFVGNSKLDSAGELSNTKVLGTQEDIDNGATNIVIAGTGTGKNGAFTRSDLNNDQAGINKAIKTLTDSLQKINDSNLGASNTSNDSSFKDNLKGLLDSLQNLTPKDKAEPGSFTYTAENGITYALEIEKDPTSPDIAPRRFGVARTLDEGVAVIKGQPSFSSDTDVLLDEVKFRLDNQLP